MSGVRCQQPPESETRNLKPETCRRSRLKLSGTGELGFSCRRKAALDIISLTLASHVNRPHIRDDLISGGVQHIEQIDCRITVGHNEFYDLPDFKVL